MTFTEVFPDYETFKTYIDDILIPAYTVDDVIIAEWLDESLMFSKWGLIYFHLYNEYKNLTLRYELTQWLSLFDNTIAEALFNLYMIQQAFVNKELSKIRDYKLRNEQTVNIESGETTSNTYGAVSSVSTKATPFTPEDGVNEKSQHTVLPGGVNTLENYNIIEDVKKLMNYQYKIGLDMFLSKFINLFRRFYAGKVNIDYSYFI